MKTPDEIKKGMECCLQHAVCPTECPYNRNDGICCMTEDAYALIQQSETKSHQLLTQVKQLEAYVLRWISVEEQPPVWPCVVYDGHNSPYTPKGCIAMLHDVEGRVDWIPEIPLDALMQGRMPELHNFPITHWMPLPEPPKEVVTHA